MHQYQNEKVKNFIIYSVSWLYFTCCISCNPATLCDILTSSQVLTNRWIIEDLNHKNIFKREKEQHKKFKYKGTLIASDHSPVHMNCKQLSLHLFISKSDAMYFIVCNRCIYKIGKKEVGEQHDHWP